MSNLIDEVVGASRNRRSFLKTIGLATAGVGALSIAGTKTAKAATSTEVQVLQFALNLEYLESEFYTYATYGRGIGSFGIGVDGQANGTNSPDGGQTTGGAMVNFNQNQLLSHDLAVEISNDERMHVTLLRDALGADKIAKPDLNLNALKLNLSTLADYLRLARIFEDIGVSAYAGAAGMLTTPSVITTAARILATEAEHTASLRTLIANLQLTTTKIDGADFQPPPSGGRAQILSVNPLNGLPAVRTPGQVLYLAFGNQANTMRGGFFPMGVNGAITTSTGPATAANTGTNVGY